MITFKIDKEYQGGNKIIYQRNDVIILLSDHEKPDLNIYVTRS